NHPHRTGWRASERRAGCPASLSRRIGVLPSLLSKVEHAGSMRGLGFAERPRQCSEWTRRCSSATRRDDRQSRRRGRVPLAGELVTTVSSRTTTQLGAVLAAFRKMMSGPYFRSEYEDPRPAVAR
ncbi:MAG TPA: hypothetical protein VF371_07660, partial [Candidatus Limnocylindrales bacterium]